MEKMSGRQREILIDPFKRYMRKYNKLTFYWSVRIFIFHNYFPAVFNFCLPFLLKKNWRDSNIITFVSILFMISTREKNGTKPFVWFNAYGLFFYVEREKKDGKMSKKMKILKGRFQPRIKKMWSLFLNCSWGFYPYVFFSSILNLCCVSL